MNAIQIYRRINNLEIIGKLDRKIKFMYIIFFVNGANK